MPMIERLAKVQASVAAHGVTGYVEPGFLEKQSLG